MRPSSIARIVSGRQAGWSFSHPTTSQQRPRSRTRPKAEAAQLPFGAKRYERDAEPAWPRSWSHSAGLRYTRSMVKSVLTYLGNLAERLKPWRGFDRSKPAEYLLAPIGRAPSAPDKRIRRCPGYGCHRATGCSRAAGYQDDTAYHWCRRAPYSDRSRTARFHRTREHS